MAHDNDRAAEKRAKEPWTSLPVTMPASPTLSRMRLSRFAMVWSCCRGRNIGSTIVHVLDFNSGEAYTAVTPEKGGFMRLTGRIDVKSAA
jgi:hypothetical protein